MTERELRITRAVDLVVGGLLNRNLTDRRRKLWVDAVIDLEPDHVEAAASTLVRDWVQLRAPRPPDLRQAAEDARRADSAWTPPPDVGMGCPIGRKLGVDCRRDRAPELTWVSDHGAGTTYCMQHRIAWRGVLGPPVEEPLFTAEEAMEKGWISPDGVLATTIGRRREAAPGDPAASQERGLRRAGEFL